VDCIYHLIGTVDVAGANADPIADLQQTVADSVRLLRLCAGRPNTRVVYVSSGGSVYGVPRTLPIPEDHPTEPLSAHGISKLTVEKYLALFSRLHGLEYQVARCANPYGEWQASAGRQGIVAALLGKLLANEPLTIWGDGRVVRDFVYVRDVAEALVRLGSRTGEPRIFNVGSGTGTSLNRLVALMADVTGREPAVEYSPGRPFDVPESVLDISRIREHCGWQPATGLRTGLAQTWRWLSEPGRHVPHPDR
jgi:UDP-glucose 4-epimerase